MSSEQCTCRAWRTPESTGPKLDQQNGEGAELGLGLLVVVADPGLESRPRLIGVDIRCLMRDATPVRTTLDIDEDVLEAAKELAASRSTTAGRVLSELARQALSPKRVPRVRNGVPLLPRRPKGSPRPTMALVNRLRDEP